MEEIEAKDQGEGRERGEVARKLAVWGIAAVVLVLAAVVALIAYKGHKKKLDETAIVTAVSESTLILRETLGAQPPADAAARLDAHLQRIKAAERTALADAAEGYVLGAREIAKRSAEAARLAAPAAAARQAVLAHLAAGGQRSDAWFKRAGDLKKRVESAHFELNVQLGALDGLIDGMHESRKVLGPLVGDKLLIEPAALTTARERVLADLKRSNAELEKARQIPLSS